MSQFNTKTRIIALNFLFLLAITIGLFLYKTQGSVNKRAELSKKSKKTEILDRMPASAGYAMRKPASFLKKGAVKSKADESSISRIIKMSRIIQRHIPLSPARNIQSSAKIKKEKNILLNDPYIRKNWGLLGHKQSDIQATEAWRVSRGSREVVVAVIDTGIDIRHEDLKNNLWVNKGESGFDKKGRDKATNGIDDDRNGFIDDVHGYNFVSDNGNLKDNHGHGCHVSGIIGAEGGNGVGVSGVSPKVSIMTLKYYDPHTRGSQNLDNTVRAIHYAVQMKADIINYSGGGLQYSQSEFDAIQLARKKGILFVAAAGNEASNSDVSSYYPANYPLDNVISVTAHQPKAKKVDSSNWGKSTVHLTAPGKHIFSTLPNAKYGSMTGTSQATAFVSGVAALVKGTTSSF